LICLSLYVKELGEVGAIIDWNPSSPIAGNEANDPSREVTRDVSSSCTNSGGETYYYSGGTIDGRVTNANAIAGDE